MLLLGACTLGESSRMAASGSSTAGSGSYSTTIFSSASLAICSVTAATAATPSPAWNTNSSASTGWSWNVGPKELDRDFLAGEHRHHAGHGFRRAGVDALDAGRGDAGALDARVEHAGEAEIVDIFGLPEAVQAAVGPRRTLADGAGLLPCVRGQRLDRIGLARQYRR